MEALAREERANDFVGPVLIKLRLCTDQMP